MSDGPQYDLYYYNTRGLCEPIRMLLSHVGAKFNDHRAPLTSFTPITPLPEEWVKRAMFGQVPILEFEGKQLTQSLAILRYLARRYNLVGKDEFEAAKCDEIIDALKDFGRLWGELYREQDPDKRKQIIDEALSKGKERYLSKFNALAEANGGYLVGNSMTSADICLAQLLDHIPRISKVTLVDDYPALQGLVNRVESSPGIKKYLENRPKTEF